jgi:hypothetical protein
MRFRVLQTEEWVVDTEIHSVSTGLVQLHINGATVTLDASASEFANCVADMPRPSRWSRLWHLLDRSPLVPVAEVTGPEGGVFLETFVLENTRDDDERASISFPSRIGAKDVPPNSSVRLVGYNWDSYLANGELIFMPQGAPFSMRPGRY